MGVESAITELIRETIEQEIEIPSDEDIEKIAVDAAESHLDTHLSDQVAEALQSDSSVRRTLLDLVSEHMASECVVNQNAIDELRAEFKQEVETRSLTYKVRAMRQRVRSWFSWAFTGRWKNARKVCIWTLLI